MSNVLKRILEKLFDIMREEGIQSIYINRNSYWNDETKKKEYTDEFSTDIHMISNRRF